MIGNIVCTTQSASAPRRATYAITITVPLLPLLLLQHEHEHDPGRSTASVVSARCTAVKYLYVVLTMHPCALCLIYEHTYSCMLVLFLWASRQNEKKMGKTVRTRVRTV